MNDTSLTFIDLPVAATETARESDTTDESNDDSDSEIEFRITESRNNKPKRPNLEAKHPNPSPSTPNCIWNPSNRTTHRLLNKCQLHQKSCMKTHASNGLSAPDANEWTIVILFKDEPRDLSKTIVEVVPRIATGANLVEMFPKYESTLTKQSSQCS